MKYDLSIVIPSWNTSKYLRQCLTSALNQKTIHDYQVILVDDGSDDDSKDVYLTFNKSNFCYYLRPHLGQAATKNYAIMKAEGEIVLILDSDDALTPDAVETVINYFRNHPGVSYVYSEHFGIDSNSNIIYKTNKKDYVTKNRSKYKEELILHCCFHGHLMAMRKSIFSTVGNFDEELSVGVDYEWILRFTKKNEAGYIPDHLYYYREHGNGINKLIDKNPRHIEEILEKALKMRNIKKRVIYAGRDQVGYRNYIFLDKTPQFYFYYS